MFRAKSLASRLVLRDAVCRCDRYLNGFEKVVHPAVDNCLPAGFDLFVRVKPFIHTRKRQTLQLESPRLNYVASVLEAANDVTPHMSAKPEYGSNYRPSPCTDYGMQVMAILDRQCIETGRPWKIETRHLRGFQGAVGELYKVLGTVIRQNPKFERTTNPDYYQRALKYTGAKREHYRQCALEIEANPLDKRAHDIYHECAGKWGELTDRPRVLLVQSIRAKGAVSSRGTVKPGAVLRAPILVEGWYRDWVEDALHHYCHKRGFNFVASGSSLRQRGEAILNMVEEGDLLLSLDWSKFDGTLGDLGVAERLAFLSRMERLFGTNPQLRTVVETQNKCTVKGGPISAQIYGNRGSGTAGTSSGNKAVVLAAIAYALGPAFGGNHGVKLYCDGDDTLIIVPHRWAGVNPATGRPWYLSWVRRFTSLGLITKVQQALRGHAAEVVEKTRFCRAAVIETHSGPLLCKEPLDAVLVMTNFRKHFRGPQFPDYLHTLHVGLKGCYGEVPVLSALSTMLSSVEGRYTRALYDSCGLEYMMANRSTLATTIVAPQARESFARTFGVPATTQVLLERALEEESCWLRDAVQKFLDDR